MDDKIVVTMKFTESEIKILIDSLNNAVFTIIPKEYHMLVRDLKVVRKMISDKKKNEINNLNDIIKATPEYKLGKSITEKTKKDYGPPYGPHNPTGNETIEEEGQRNGEELCDNCET